MNPDLVLEPGFVPCPACNGDGETAVGPCNHCTGEGWVVIGIGWSVYEQKDPLADTEPKGGVVVDVLHTDVDTETGEIVNRLRYVTIRYHRRHITNAILRADELAEMAEPPNSTKLRQLVRAIHAELGSRKTTDGPWELRLEGWAHRLTSFVANGMAA